MKLRDFKESTEKQLGGTPIYAGDAVFYIKRFGTPESDEFLNKLRRDLFGPSHKTQITDEHLLWAHWLIEYGCVGWDGLLEEKATEEDSDKWFEIFEKFKKLFSVKKNKELEKEKKEIITLLPYSKEAARNIFLDKEYRMSLNKILINGAINFENYLYDEINEELEEIKKP